MYPDDQTKVGLLSLLISEALEWASPFLEQASLILTNFSELISYHFGPI